MSFRTVSSGLASAPVRTGLTVTAGIAGLPGIFAAVRPGTMPGMMHSLLPVQGGRSPGPLGCARP